MTTDRETNSLTPYMGVCGFFLLVKFATSLTHFACRGISKMFESCWFIHYYFILKTRELSANRKYLPAPTLVVPTRFYQASGPHSCSTPQQLTIHLFIIFCLVKMPLFIWEKINYSETFYRISVNFSLTSVICLCKYSRRYKNNDFYQI